MLIGLLTLLVALPASVAGVASLFEPSIDIEIGEPVFRNFVSEEWAEEYFIEPAVVDISDWAGFEVPVYSRSANAVRLTGVRLVVTNGPVSAIPEHKWHGQHSAPSGRSVSAWHYRQRQARGQFIMNAEAFDDLAMVHIPIIVEVSLCAKDSSLITTEQAVLVSGDERVFSAPMDKHVRLPAISSETRISNVWARLVESRDLVCIVQAFVHGELVAERDCTPEFRAWVATLER